MVTMHRALLTAAAAVFLSLALSPSASANSQSGESAERTALYCPITLELDADQDYRAAAVGDADSDDPNPWVHRRLNVVFDHPDLARPVLVPGYFAGDGQGRPDGCIWRVHFTPQLTGDWIWFATFESGPLLNAAPSETTGDSIALQVDSGQFTVTPLNPMAPGFQSKGVVTSVPGQSYFRFSEPSAGRFIVAGAGSPENFLGYAGFAGAEDGRSANGAVCCCRQNCFSDCRRTTCQSTDDPAPNFLHRYEAHVSDWREGDPDWSTNGLPEQGRGIIGALNYLGDHVDVNSLYFMLMNLGGDGKDTHPFLTNGGGMDCPSSGSGFSPAHTLNYHVQRMDQWRTVLEHAGNKGIMVQLILAEQEACNIRWFGPHDSNGGARSHMSVYRRLFMKQMVAEFGHLHALRWNLCEENKAASSCASGSGCGAPSTPLSPQFTPAELDEMARWIRSWDSAGHPIGVHTVPNTTRIYQDLLALPEQPTWLSTTSLQIHGESGTGPEYEAVTQSAAHVFEQAGQIVPIINDEQGSPGAGLSSQFNSSAEAASTSDDRRRRVLYDVMLSGGHVSYYFGYYELEDGGGDLRCEDFRTRESALEQLGIARRLMEMIRIWDMTDADDLLVGSTSSQRFGRPEVAVSGNGARLAVYYPSLRTQPTSPVLTGSIDLRALLPLTYEVLWIDPKTGDRVGEEAQMQGGALTPVPIPDINGDGIPGNAITPDTDLVLLLLRRGPTPTSTE